MDPDDHQGLSDIEPMTAWVQRKKKRFVARSNQFPAK
jgi:hypothetical protein